MSINDEIRAQTEAFVNDLTVLVRRAALEAVQAALGNAPTVAPVKAAPAKAAAPAKKAAPAPVAAKKAAVPAPAKKPAVKPAPSAKVAASAKKPVPVKRPLGAKRPPAELAALVERLHAWIVANPGQGVELIGKALQTPTSDLSLPLKKLIAGNRIRFEGVKRATKYYPV